MSGFLMQLHMILVIESRFFGTSKPTIYHVLTLGDTWYLMFRVNLSVRRDANRTLHCVDTDPMQSQAIRPDL